MKSQTDVFEEVLIINTIDIRIE